MFDTEGAEAALAEATDGVQFYRCVSCAKVVNPWQIKAGEGCVCGDKKVRPTNLTLWEKIVQIAKHPKVWTWPKS